MHATGAAMLLCVQMYWPVAPTSPPELVETLVAALLRHVSKTQHFMKLHGGTLLNNCHCSSRPGAGCCCCQGLPKLSMVHVSSACGPVEAHLVIVQGSGYTTICCSGMITCMCICCTCRALIQTCPTMMAGRPWTLLATSTRYRD